MSLPPQILHRPNPAAPCEPGWRRVARWIPLAALIVNATRAAIDLIRLVAH